MKETFSEYLNNLLYEENISGRELVRQLHNEGQLITRSTFFNYLNGETIPKLNTALSILLYLKKNIKKEDAQELLNNSYASKEERVKETNEYSRCVQIKLNEEDEDMLTHSLEKYDGNFSKYVNELVRKDLNKLRKELYKYEIWQVIRERDGYYFFL